MRVYTEHGLLIRLMMTKMTATAPMAQLLKLRGSGWQKRLYQNEEERKQTIPTNSMTAQVKRRKKKLQRTKCKRLREEWRSRKMKENAKRQHKRIRMTKAMVSRIERVKSFSQKQSVKFDRWMICRMLLMYVVLHVIQFVRACVCVCGCVCALARSVWHRRHR